MPRDGNRPRYRSVWPTNEMDASTGLCGIGGAGRNQRGIWRSYGSQIQQELRRDRVTTTSAMQSNIGDEDVPF